MARNSYFTLTIAFGVSIALAFGCSSGGPSIKAIHGSVTFDGKPVDAGQLRFIPVEGTPGPMGIAEIIDGKYEVKARGGVPVGKLRVEVEAFQKTGRKVQGKPPFQGDMIDELLPIGAPQYRGESSPMIVDVATYPTGEINIEVPRE